MNNLDYSVFTHKPTWQLKKMIKALSIHSWLNTDQDKVRLQYAKIALKQRMVSLRKRRTSDY